MALRRSDFLKLFLPALYIATVLTILLIPAFTMNTKKDLFIENRKAAKFPELSIRNYRNIAPQFEKYLADRFGMRKYFIAGWNAIQLYGFHEAHEQIVLGKNGFVFLASHFSGEAHRNELFKLLLDCNENTVRKNVNELLYYKNQFQTAKVPMLFVIVPTKHSLNFDQLPDDLKATFADNPDGVPCFTAVTRKLAEIDPAYAGNFFLDLYDDAMVANQKMQLIPIKNFHWVPGPYTHLAAYQIARRFGVIQEDFRLHKENYQFRYTRSDLNKFLGLNPRNKAWCLSPGSCPYSRLPVSRKFALKNAPAEFDKLEFYSENPQAPSGRILVIGDSFTNPLCQDLARYFSQVITMEFSAMQKFSMTVAQAHLEEINRLYRPDYIVSVSHCSYIYLDIISELAKKRK